jgi:hypothetical protein
MLIFPSYYRRERPELVGHPAALVSYRFNGFLDEIYATLVVRLHHTKPFTQDQLWRYAADFKTLTGKQLGVKLERRAEGAGELVVYADLLLSALWNAGGQSRGGNGAVERMDGASTIGSGISWKVKSSDG